MSNPDTSVTTDTPWIDPDGDFGYDEAKTDYDESASQELNERYGGR